MRFLIAFDIDGTLRDEQYGIPDSAKKAIAICREKGHIPCLCTGRSIGMIQQDVLELGFETIIAGGGSYIVHKKDVIKRESFSKDSMEQIREYCSLWKEELPFAISLEGEQEIFMNEKAVVILEEMNEKKWKTLTREQVQYIKENEKISYHNNFNYWEKETNIHKLCLWSDKKYFQDIKEKLGNEMVLAQWGQWNDDYYYEMVKKGSDKGDAIEELCAFLNIPLEQTIGFGDGKNDISMLQACHVAVAMENGSEELKKVATSICETPMQDGIYKELERRKVI